MALANLPNSLPFLLGHVALVQALGFCDLDSCQSGISRLRGKLRVRIGLLTTRVWSTLLCKVTLLAHWDVVLSFDRSGKGAGEHDGHDAEGELHVDGVDEGGRLKVLSWSCCLFDLFGDEMVVGC
jgi:hypothetical protein